MGRESTIACIPTSFVWEGSRAPMENSPPGIHTMPSGALPGGGAELGMLGSKPPLREDSCSASATDARWKMYSVQLKKDKTTAVSARFRFAADWRDARFFFLRMLDGASADEQLPACLKYIRLVPKSHSI